MVLVGGVLVLFDVDLLELDVPVVGGQFLQDRVLCVTGATPVGVEIEQSNGHWSVARYRSDPDKRSPSGGARRSETFRRATAPEGRMSGSQGGGGLMSSAGLVRYFDAEDRNAIRIDPKTIVAFGVLFGVLVQVLNVVSL